MSGENVFLVAADGAAEAETLQTAVAFDDYPDRPAALADHEAARLHGVQATDANRTYFENMAPGDLLLFHEGDRYVGAGYVGTAFEDDDGWVADTFWETDDATLIYTVTEYTSVSVPRAKVHTIFGYSASYAPQGFSRVADSRVSNRLAAIKHAVETVSD